MDCSSTSNNYYYSLADSIYLFAKAKAEELPRSEQELAAFLSQPVDPLIRENYLHQLRCLALQQVANPILESLREGISNSCDAQVRAAQEFQPVQASLNGRTFTLTDHGTGVDYRGIPLLFVDGKTSNPEAIFSVQKGLSNVAGRFGQGFKSLFYYLVYAWKEKPKAQFIKTEQGDLEISIPLACNGQSYRILFRKTPGQPVEIFPPAVDPLLNGKRKLIFWTRQGEDSFQLRFKEQKGELCWRLKPKFKAEVGTQLTIESPLFETHAQEILKGLSSLFAYLHPTPLLLNGKLVNSYEGMIKYQFPGCTLFVSTALSSEGGKLVIAEKGRPLVTLEQENGPLQSQMMILSFAALPLSHERSTLNWQNPEVQSAFRSLTSAIIESKTFSASQKLDFLNPMALALRENRCNLTNNISALIYLQIYQASLMKRDGAILLPDSPGTRDMKVANALYVHPDYLKSPLWRLQGQYSQSLFKIDHSEHPIGYYGTQEKGWLFVNTHLLSQKNLHCTLYNIQLAKAWLDNFRKGGDKPPIEFPVTELPAIPKPSSQTKPSQNNFFTAENCKQTTSPEDAEDFLFDETTIQWREKDPLIKIFLERTKYFPLASFYFLCDFLFVQRKEFVQRLIDENASSLEEWVKDFALIACIDNPSWKPSPPVFINGQWISPVIKPLTSGELEIQAHFTTTFFDQMAGMATEQMRRCFVAYLSKNFKLAGIDFAISFSHFYSAIETVACTDQECAISFFAVDHEKLIRISPTVLRTFLQRFPQSHQQKVLLAFHPLEIDPAHFMHWTDQELYEFIDDLIITSPKTNGVYVGVTKYILKSYPAKSRLNSKQNEQLHILYQTISCSYRPLRQCLLPYIFNDMLTVNAFYSQSTYLNIDWAEFIKMIGQLINVAKLEESKVLQSIALFEKTLNLATTFIDIFLDVVALDKKAEHLKTPERQKAIISARSPRFIGDVSRCPVELQMNFGQWMDAYSRLSRFHPFIGAPELFPKEDQRAAWMAVLNNLETLRLIPDEVRPWIYALYLCTARPQCKSVKFTLPPITGDKGKLEDDSFLQEYFGSSEVARQKIQSARLQNPAPHFFITEILKNAEEAGATEVKIETHLTPQMDQLVSLFADNGSGMEEEKELTALRTPGYTTKKRTVVGSNYGQGVFSIFEPTQGHGHLTVVTRSHANPEGHLHHFTAAPAGISLQKQKYPKQNAGSTFILGKKVHYDPSLELILFEANLIQAVRYIEGVAITFNGRSIKGASHNPALCLNTHFVDPQGKPQEILGEVINGEGSLFAKGKKIGDLPSEYLEWIPPFMRELMRKNGLSVSLFLKESGDQLMGRSQLVADPLTVKEIKALVLRLSFLAILHQWKNRALLDILSEDFWDLRKENVYALTLKAEGLSAYYTHPKENPLNLYLEAENEIRENATLLEAVKKYLAENTALIPIEDQKGLLAQLQGQHDQVVAQKIDQQSTLISLLHSNLPGTNISLQTLRKKILDAVHSAGIIEQHAYSMNNSEKVDEVFQALLDALPLDLNPLVAYFKQKLGLALNSCKTQQIDLATKPCGPCPELEQFLIRMAKQVFNKEITVQFYSAADHRLAFVRPPSNCIWVNLAGNVAPFHRLINDLKALVPQAEWMKQHGPILVKWLETLAHELTHLEENIACEGETHSPAFYKKVAANLEPLFEQGDVPLAVKILEEILSKPDVVMG